MILSRLKDTLKPWLFSLFPRWYYPYSAGWAGTAGAPLTSTSWDGDDTYSTTAKTLIDLSTDFGVPAGVKAVLVKVGIKDTASATADAYIILAPNNTAGQGFAHRIRGLVNSVVYYQAWVVPCDANGDVFYQLVASGAGTLTAIIEVWGYCL